ncbi:MAG: Druantia anti-phage system protein DruA [Nitriliruptoraceae bacterium]
MTDGPAPEAVRYHGRDFTPDDLEVIRGIAARLPTRNQIAQAVCQALGWRRIDGRPKDMSARLALLRMADDGLITLPPPRNRNGNGRHTRYLPPDPQLALDLDAQPMPATLATLGPIRLAVVEDSAASTRWRTLIATHHYLGHAPFAGAQLRYLAESSHGTVAALGFAASAWKCAPRDTHIGWDAATREARLHLVVGNARFLIPPQVTVPNLASHLLAAAARRLAADWQQRYGYRPVLLETFVETGRFTGAAYKAANWTCVGQTKGRGKLDHHHQRAVPVKDIYLRPLHRHWRRILTAPPT